MSAAYVVVVSRDELETLVESAVARAFVSHLRVPEPSCDWIGDAEVAAMLGRKPGSVRKLAGLPVHKVGRKRRYLRSEVEQFMQRGPAARAR